jgi:hypothetical protein
MKYKRGILATIVVLILVSISIFPAINGDVELKVIENLNLESNIKNNQITTNTEIYSIDTSNDYPIFCSFLTSVYIVLLPISVLFKELELDDTIFYIPILLLVNTVIDLMYEYCGEWTILDVNVDQLTFDSDCGCIDEVDIQNYESMDDYPAFFCMILAIIMQLILNIAIVLTVLGLDDTILYNPVITCSTIVVNLMKTYC